MLDKIDLESELDSILAELEQLYAQEHADIPYVNDRLKSEIYRLHDRRDEIKRLLAAADDMDTWFPLG